MNKNDTLIALATSQNARLEGRRIIAPLTVKRPPVASTPAAEALHPYGLFENGYRNTMATQHEDIKALIDVVRTVGDIMFPVGGVSEEFRVALKTALNQLDDGSTESLWYEPNTKGVPSPFTVHLDCQPVLKAGTVCQVHQATGRLVTQKRGKSNEGFVNWTNTKDRDCYALYRSTPLQGRSKATKEATPTEETTVAPLGFD